MASMKNRHKMFVQAMMSEKTLKETEMIELMNLCYQNDDPGAPRNANAELKDLETMVNTVNANIRPFHMEIRKGVSEEDGLRYYTMVNNCESGASLTATDYTSIELEFFKRIVEMIVTEAKNGSISTIAALNAVDKGDRHLSKRDAQDLIKRFVHDQWLFEKSGSLSLHIRSMVELEHYLRDVYPDDLIYCWLCKQIVMKGQDCCQCEVKLHDHCAARFWRDRTDAKCPQCKNAWRQSKKNK